MLSTTSETQFTTRNNTRIVVQIGGLAILPCTVKINSPATVCNSYNLRFSIYKQFKINTTFTIKTINIYIPSITYHQNRGGINYT